MEVQVVEVDGVRYRVVVHDLPGALLVVAPPVILIRRSPDHDTLLAAAIVAVTEQKRT